jgi:hypothetical protein
VVQHYYQNQNSIQGRGIWVDSEMAIDESKILKTVSVTVTAEELARSWKGVPSKGSESHVVRRFTKEVAW